MDARENRFKKLRKLGKREGESYFDDLLQESQHREKDMNKAPATKVEERPKAMETDAILEKFKFENKPKKAPGFLRQLSSEGKNTADSDGNNSPDQSGGSPERLRLKRLKKILNPSETKESFEEEIKDEPECPICLSKIEKDSARINCCNHIFCFDCIKEWTDVANQCPLCKKRISRIQKFSADGVKINEVRIKFKEQEFQEPEFETIENTDEACYECGSASDMQRLLVCDQCHFYCCHTYCCSPPLRRVPIDPWYCNFCRPDNMEAARPVNRDREAQRSRNNRVQRSPPENPPARRNNLSRTNTMRSNESAVTQSIRNSLAEDSFLKRLFDVVDKEQDGLSKKKRTQQENSLFREFTEKETKRRPSKSTKKTTKRKSRKSEKSKDSSRERSRSKSAKSKAIRRKPKERSRSIKRTGDKKKRVTKKRSVSSKKKN